jgi:hypothetical protein
VPLALNVGRRRFYIYYNREIIKLVLTEDLCVVESALIIIIIVVVVVVVVV